MTIHCPHRPPCPGCPALNRKSISAEKLTGLAALAASEGADLEPVLYGADQHYRVRARLAVRGRPGRPKIGIFQEASHLIADIPDCPVHHPAINDVAAAVKTAMRELRTPPYVEGPGLGLVRYLQLVVQRSTSRVQLVIVVRDEEDPELEPLLVRVTTLLGDRLHSLWTSENRDRGNRILGSQFNLRSGVPWLHEEFAGRSLHFHPGAFGQSNLDLAESMVRWIDDRVPTGSSIVELHGGVGAIGLGLARNSNDITINEISPWGLAGLRRSIDENADLAEKVRIAPGAAADCQELLPTAEVVICDPPRKGMEPELVEALGVSSAQRIIAVYCGYQAFLRDAAQLTAAGKFRMTSLLPVALFPHTDHVEVVGVFDRNNETQLFNDG